MNSRCLHSFGRRLPALFPFFVLILSTPFQAHPQQLAAASLGGAVVDPAGLTINSAAVTLTNSDQGTVRTFTTEKDGAFSFTNLAAGDYVLAVHGGAGFSGFHQMVELAVGQSLQIPVTLTVESTQTKVEVTSGTIPEVDTVNSVDGGVIAAQRIANLPLNGRNYLELSLLVPGNAPAPNFDPTKVNTVVISSAGQVGRGSNVSVDGADNNDDVVGGPLVNIPEDAVQEFQIATNRFSAALGRSGSPVTNVVTRQGSNSIHGEVEYMSATRFCRDCRRLTIRPSVQHRLSIASNTLGISEVRSGRTRPGGLRRWKTGGNWAQTWWACATPQHSQLAEPLPRLRCTTFSAQKGLTGKRRNRIA
jgi:hypothetical protein